MDNEKFDLFLTGRLAEGSSRDAALQQLGKLFKREPDQVKGLLNGRPTRIRKGLNSAELEKFETVFARLGILTEVIPALGELGPAISPAKPATETAIAREAASAPPAALALEPAGSLVLKENERRRIQPANIDTSALSIAGHGEMLSAARKPPPPPPATEHLSLAETGSDLIEHPRKQATRDIDALCKNLRVAD